MSFLLTSLHALSTSTKYVLLLLLALNAHSLPFVWHVRFWWRLLPRAWVVKTRGRQTYLDQCEGSIRSLGGVSAKTISRRRAWFDDCDYNMHLSNSCYAKSVDHANSKWLWQNMPAFHEAGGYSALGGTHYTFIKEIPILSSYTIETRLVGWGDKWYYLVNEFIIYPKPKKGRSKSLDAHTPGALTPPSTATKSGDSTPVQNSAAPLDLASHAAAALRTPKKRDDGGVVACIAVHELCMKVGRITVPPRIGFYLAGHASSPNDRSRARSLASDRKTASAWLAGGWKAEENAADLGRDIEPYQTSDAKDEKSSGSVVQAQMDRVVKGMAGVAVGLCEVTSA